MKHLSVMLQIVWFIILGVFNMISLIIEQWDAIDPVTHNTTGDACFASGWVDHLRSRITAFIQKTGLSMLETDGPYGYVGF